MRDLLNNEDLATIVEIDREHQKIATFISHLGKLANQDKPDFRKVKRAIVILGSYIKAHISYEEDWLARNVEQFNEHIKDVNNKFPVIYQGLKDKVEKENNCVEVLEVLYEYTKGWFAEHINTTQDIVCKTIKDEIPSLEYLAPTPQIPTQTVFLSKISSKSKYIL